MPGYRVRVLRNDGQVVYDSGSPGAIISASVIDKPGPGTWSYQLQLLAVSPQFTSGGAPALLTRSNGISLLKSNR